MTVNGFTIFAQDRRETTWGRMIYPNTYPPIPPQAKPGGMSPIRGGLLLIGGLLALIAIASIASGGASNSTNDSSGISGRSVSVAGTTTALDTSGGSMLASYQTVDVRDLKKNPDGFKGQRVQLTGDVFNIRVSGNVTDLQFYVPIPGGTAYDREAVQVHYVGDTTGIYEKTRITVYGVAQGSGGGTNAFGASLSQPLIAAQRIEIVTPNATPASTKTA